MGLCDMSAGNERILWDCVTIELVMRGSDGTV